MRAPALRASGLPAIGLVRAAYFGGTLNTFPRLQEQSQINPARQKTVQIARYCAHILGHRKRWRMTFPNLSISNATPTRTSQFALVPVSPMFGENFRNTP